MKEQAKFVLGVVVIIIFFGWVYHSFKYDTQVSPLGGKDEMSAIQISQNENIEISIIIEKNDRLSDICVYWDDNENEKQKLKKGFFTAEGQIQVPDKIGVHKLTVETGFLKTKYNYYYDVIRGKSD